MEQVSSIREVIKDELELGTSFLVLKDVPNKRSHYWAIDYLPWQLTSRPNIVFYFCFNLKDFIGRHYSKAKALPL